MKLLTRLGALEKQIRGWLPMESAILTGALNARRRTFISAAGAFFVAVGALFIPLAIPSYYVIDGPLAQFLCPPRAPCAPIYLDVSLIAPVFLMVIGEVLAAFGLHFRSERHRRPIKMTLGAGGVFFAAVAAYLLSYVPSIPPYSYVCNSTMCVSSMTPITPFFLIFFGAAIFLFGVLYRKSRGPR